MAAGSVGTWLLLTHDGGDEDSAEGMALQFNSTVGRGSGNVTAILRF